MTRCFLLAVLFSMVTLSLVHADEQVTLKSGTKLIGKVTYSDDNQSITVKTGDSAVKLSMSEVDVIGPVGASSTQSADRLLMIALEAQLQQGTSAGQMGLLAEAYRTAPNDARIAYWYARSLVDAGFGSAAAKIIQEHREGIDLVYPGLLARLDQQIRDRMSVENLPAQLVKRIDELNQSVNRTPGRSDRVPMFVRFRLVDDRQKPIDRKMFRVSANGNDERLESFGQGYHLFTFDSYRNNQHNCRIMIDWPGLESKEISLEPSPEQVADAGDLSVKRLGEEDKVQFSLVVVDYKGNSLANVPVTVTPNTSEGTNRPTTVKTDTNGRATFRLFPMNHNYSIAAKGFKREGGNLNPQNENDSERRVELFPIMSAKVRVAWIIESLQSDASLMSGETVLELGEGVSPQPYGMEGGNLIRADQVGDRITLQSGPPYFGGGIGQGTTSWIRRAPQDLMKNDPLKFFEGIDLKKVDELQSKFESPEMNNRGPRTPYAPFSIKVKEGEVYAGKFPSRDMRTGQPALVSVKVFVEKIATEPSEND